MMVVSKVKHFGPIGDISAFPSNVIIVEIDENGNILGSLQNQDGKVRYGRAGIMLHE